MSEGERRLLTVGLTGGIACGRSTLGRLFARLGACVIDMDHVAHALLAPGGTGVEPVAAAFGAGVRAARGGIDRGALGALVFADAAARARLEAILHPMIIEESERRVRAFSDTHPRGIAMVDAALLVETGGWRRYQRLVVVVCDPALQLQRLMARDGLTEPQARARIAAQSPMPEKILLADYVIDTSGTLAQSEDRAHDVYAQLREDLDLLPDLPERRER